MSFVDSYYDAAVSGADPIDERAGFADMLKRIAGNEVCSAATTWAPPIKGGRPGQPALAATRGHHGGSLGPTEIAMRAAT
jgi:hypothetical protein